MFSKNSSLVLKGVTGQNRCTVILYDLWMLKARPPGDAGSQQPSFDSVDHSGLISRLAQHVVLQWFRSSLTDGTFTDHSSLPASLSCGGPQGSSPGPALFSLYMLLLGVSM